MSKRTKRAAKSAARVPVQDRGIKTRMALMEAGKKAFAKYGYHDVIADQIAKEAGVAVGSFYAYFNNKRDLFLEVIDEITTKSADVINESLRQIFLRRSQNIEHWIRKMIVVLVDIHKESESLLRELLRMSLYDEEARARLEQIDRLVRQLIEAALEDMVGATRKRERESIAYVFYYAAEGVVHQMVLERGEIDEKRVIRELSKLLAARIKDRFGVKEPREKRGQRPREGRGADGK
ncbi:TetR/AcrR family transcriptional regulator [Candidatus Poribacteria bacterium]|nr:TetR/AcrR family transcriptional regulator [Candidatus Poribacteria bacterium]